MSPQKAAAAVDVKRVVRPSTLRAAALGALTVVLVAVFATLVRANVGGPFAARAVDDLGQLAAATVGAGCCLWRAGTAAGRTRASWACFGAALAAWAMGEIVWSYYELVAQRPTPFPSWADAGYLLFPAFALPGLMLRPSSALAGRGWLKVGLDGVMVVCSLFTITWATSLGSVYKSGAPNLFAFGVSLAYPVTDLFMLTVGLIVLAHARHRAGLTLLVAGSGLMAVADSGFAYLTATGSYQTGALTDMGWFAAFLLMGVAALRSPSADEANEQGLESPLFLALPYATVVAGASCELRLIAGGHASPVTLYIQGAGFAALILRQLVTVLDNRRLTDNVIAQQAELRHRAFHDALTGLANRALFHDRVTHALDLHRRDQRAVQIMFVDLDDFKTVNDTLGHDAGDALLRAVGEILQRNTRDGDTVARLGGDEFAVLVEGDADIDSIAGRVLESLADPLELCGRQVIVRCSLGTASVEADDDAIAGAELLRRADRAMYAAKAAGKGLCVSYDPSLSRHAGQDLDERLALAEDIRAGRLRTALQPIVTATGDLYGYEALARWRHHDAEVPPDRFIPMAERLGLVCEVDLLVAESAVAYAASSELRCDLIIAVNIGLTRRYDPTMPQRLLEVLSHHGMPPSRLVIELPETQAVKDEHTVGVLRDLRGLGLRIAVDDFGIGYSNLARLSTLTPDIIKLDRSLIERVCESPATRRLVSGTVALAHDLGALVIAEGVESRPQRDILIDIGCDALQGYLFGVPEIIDETIGAPALGAA